VFPGYPVLRVVRGSPSVPRWIPSTKHRPRGAKSAPCSIRIVSISLFPLTHSFPTNIRPACGAGGTRSAPATFGTAPDPFRVIRVIRGSPVCWKDCPSTCRAFPVAPQLPTYAPPRGFCATGADHVACRKLLTAFNLRNMVRTASPCQFGQDWHRSLTLRRVCAGVIGHRGRRLRV